MSKGDLWTCKECMFCPGHIEELSSFMNEENRPHVMFRSDPGTIGEVVNTGRIVAERHAPNQKTLYVIKSDQTGLNHGRFEHEFEELGKMKFERTVGIR